MRSIRRWFSKNFHTPYPVVEDMPDEEVLQHYFEEQYGDLKLPDLRELAEEVLFSPEEREKRKAQKEEDMDAFLEQEAAKLPAVLPQVAAPVPQAGKPATPEPAELPEEFAMKF